MHAVFLLDISPDLRGPIHKTGDTKLKHETQSFIDERYIIVRVYLYNVGTSLNLLHPFVFIFVARDAVSFFHFISPIIRFFSPTLLLSSFSLRKLMIFVKPTY